MTQLPNHSLENTCQVDGIRCRIPKAALGAATLALALSATATLAAPLTINHMSDAGSVEFAFSSEVSDIFLSSYDRVGLSFDDSSLGDVYAGAFNGEAQSAEDDDSFDITTLYRNENEVILYCLDIFNYLKYGSGFVKYNVFEFDKNVAEEPTTLTTLEDDTVVTGSIDNVLDFLGALNDELTDNYSYGFGDRNWLNPANRWISGAIQVGIWESLYDETFNLSGGHFSVSGLKSEGKDLLDATFGRMSTTSSLDNNQVLVFQPVNSETLVPLNGQTLIGDPVKVPTPGTLVLLLSGLFLLGKASWGRSQI